VGGDFLISSAFVMTSVDLGALLSVGGIFEANSMKLVSLSAPMLLTVGSYVEVASCDDLASVDLGNLTTVVGNFNLSDNTSLTSVDIHSLVTVGGVFSTGGDTDLTSILCGSWVPTDGTIINCGGCALSTTTVQLILRRCVLAGVTTCTISLDGGTSAGTASLNAQGQADVITLAGQLTINP
jgi:hypothetical protein